MCGYFYTRRDRKTEAHDFRGNFSSPFSADRTGGYGACPNYVKSIKGLFVVDNASVPNSSLLLLTFDSHPKIQLDGAHVFMVDRTHAQ
jgi:hypothetical protein